MAITTLAVVPARMASTRLPGKPLMALQGRSVVQWVHDATQDSGVFDRVLVATDDERIAEVVRGFGGECVMTAAEISTGSERVAAAADSLDESFDVVANIQGDQPFVSATDLAALIEPFRGEAAPDMSTLAAPLDPELADDPNSVKVVTDVHGRALYFSRSRIPGSPAGTPAPPPMRHHLGLYAFRADFLPVFAGLEPTPLEQFEQLEQLRALEHGYNIAVGPAERSTIEINTQEDFDRALESLDRSNR